jgi:crotonobetainyl-CoA:carnitine CoA-transferase CaiB-like acyl-CoA transferase
MTGPLNGVRVLDLSRILTGPFNDVLNPLMTLAAAA